MNNMPFNFPNNNMIMLPQEVIKNLEERIRILEEKVKKLEQDNNKDYNNYNTYNNYPNMYMI